MICVGTQPFIRAGWVQRGGTEEWCHLRSGLEVGRDLRRQDRCCLWAPLQEKMPHLSAWMEMEWCGIWRTRLCNLICVYLICIWVNVCLFLYCGHASVCMLCACVFLLLCVCKSMRLEKYRLFYVAFVLCFSVSLVGGWLNESFGQRLRYQKVWFGSGGERGRQERRKTNLYLWLLES